MIAVPRENSAFLGEYASVVFKNVRLLLHDGVDVYLDEEPLARYLAESLTEQGWPSQGGHVPYPGGRRKADMVTELPAHRLKITNEMKYMVCDWPGCRRPSRPWMGISGAAAQHIGLQPGKAINAVDDVKKLTHADGSHVSFLLVRFESLDRCGDADLKRFVTMSGLGNSCWTRYDDEWDWPHPKSEAHVVKCHLWCRPVGR
jgi:hypothetical protein